MIPSYEHFMRPLLDALSTESPSSPRDLATACATALDLPEEAWLERVAWDNRPVIEARVREAAADLEIAGLLKRGVAGIELTGAGSTARAELPAAIDVSLLTTRFPDYAAHRAELRQRRGA